MRTHHCGALRAHEKGQEVALCGWVQTIRHKGPLLWIDVRDRYGITQVTLEQEHCNEAVWALALTLHREDVLRVKGKVVLRQEPNPELPTGEIEILPHRMERLNSSIQPPFLIKEVTDGREELRMRYRYLDLRRPPLQRALQLRHDVVQAVRNYLNKQDCMEIETPLLIKSTPEGARDFVVPSRNYPGDYYALPQSPQLFKQLLMISGIDRYYQLAKCFRDEDLRADRQPEFTQIDCEFSFVGVQEIMEVFEGLIRKVFTQCASCDLPPCTLLTFDEAMQQYGIDRPDLRWKMRFKEVTSFFSSATFAPLSEAKRIIALCVEGGATLSRKVLDQLTKEHRTVFPKVHGPFFVQQNKERKVKTSLSKYCGEEVWEKCFSLLSLKAGDMMVMVSGDTMEVYEALGKLRLAFPSLLKMSPSCRFAPVWVTDFPLLAWQEEEQRYEAIHHPFTAPKEEDLPLLAQNPLRVRAQSYDFVLNGVELGGGSVRIHQQKLQKQVLAIMGYSEEAMEERFGFLLEALTFGAPPHGGFAIGLARLCQVLGGEDSIRSYIAFPKNNAGRDTMLKAPAPLPS